MQEYTNVIQFSQPTSLLDHASVATDLSGHSFGGYTLVSFRTSIYTLLLDWCRPVPESTLSVDGDDWTVFTSPGDCQGNYGPSWSP